MQKNNLSSNQEIKTSFSLQQYFTPAVWLGLILLLGIVLRLYNLGVKSYWVDEMFSVVEGQQSIIQLLTSGRFDQPPAYYLPFHFWMQIFGSNEVSTRLFSALAGIGSIILIYLTGRELFNKSIGLISAFLMAISSFQIYYSQITRYYSFFEMMTLLSFLLFILALKRKKTIYFALNGLASVLMVESHLFGVFILAAQNLFLLLQWKKYKELIKPWILSQILVLIGSLIYFFVVISGVSDFGGWFVSHVGKKSAPILSEPLHILYRFIFPSRILYGRDIISVSITAAGIFLAVGILIFIVRQGLPKWSSAWKGMISNLKDETDLTGKLLLISLWLLCPILIPFIFSLVSTPISGDRYSICAAPALYLLMAFVIYNTRKAVPLIISLGVIVIMIAPSLGYYYSHDIKFINEQWQEVAVMVEKNSTPDDVIVFAPLDEVGIQQKTFNWYYRGGLPSCGIPWTLPDTEVKEILYQCVKDHDRFWVIIRGTEEHEPYNRFIEFFQKSDQISLNLLQEHQFVGVSVYLFELKK